MTDSPDKFEIETILTHGGRDPQQTRGTVNTPVYRASTVLFPTLDALQDYALPFRYGRDGNPTLTSVEDTITALEGAAGTVLAPSGVSAISTAMLSVVNAGDDVLMTDSAYEPTRNFARDFLGRMGVAVRFYDPRIGGRIADLIAPNTSLIMAESPGSLTFEVQDLPAIARAAQARGARVAVDNTWATPLYYRPLSLGADLVIHAATKMFGGHSDVMFGTVSATAECFPALKRTHRLLGVHVGPDDAFLVARGLRTLAIRMAAHEERTLEIARFLKTQPGVLNVLHPALPEHPDHAIFKRDFSGSGSLFSIVLEPRPRADLQRMVDTLRLFGMGYSWGGFESLLLPIPTPTRTAVPWAEPGQLIRLQIGFESLNDLKADLADALARYRGA
jgi:cystathionine beta-lyase